MQKVLRNYVRLFIQNNESQINSIANREDAIKIIQKETATIIDKNVTKLVKQVSNKT